jgi:hypothetical protein
MPGKTFLIIKTCVSLGLLACVGQVEHRQVELEDVRRFYSCTGVHRQLLYLRGSIYGVEESALCRTAQWRQSSVCFTEAQSSLSWCWPWWLFICHFQERWMVLVSWLAGSQCLPFWTVPPLSDLFGTFPSAENPHPLPGSAPQNPEGFVLGLGSQLCWLGDLAFQIIGGFSVSQQTRLWQGLQTLTPARRGPPDLPPR